MIKAHQTTKKDSRRHDLARKHLHPLGETNLDNSGWSQMEHVLKTTIRPAHDSTSHRKETWKSTSTLLRATRLWLKARRTTVTGWKTAHWRETMNRSQTWSTKATWARTNAGVFMSNPGLKSHGCWIRKVAHRRHHCIRKSVKTRHTVRQ